MVGIGDVLCTRTNGWAGRLIRFGAALRDEPDIDNHVAIVHHRDAAGTWWAVEGRPGGTGWIDAESYLASRWTLNNTLQQRTDGQREQIARVAVGLLGTPYDWAGIVADAMTAIHAPDLWARNWRGQGPPGHLVCSALAGWVYEQAGLPHPAMHTPRQTTPGDWAQFILLGGYNAGPAPSVERRGGTHRTSAH